MASARESEAFFALMRELLGHASARSGAPAEVDGLESGVDALLRSAEWRLFAPLVLVLLGDHRELLRSLPADTGASLRRQAARIVALDMDRQRIVARIGACLRDANVAVMLLKGAALTGWVYPTEAPRLGFDLDLLVRTEDMARFSEALAGVAEETNKLPDRPSLARLAYERSFWTLGPVATELDVHEALCYRDLYPIDHAALWARSSPHPVYGLEAVRVPSPEDMLSHLALHALHELRARSRHDVDAALLIGSQTIDWDLFSAQVRSWGIGGAAYFLLERIARDLGTAVPQETLRSLRPGPMRRLLGRWILGTGPPRTRGATERTAHRLRQLTAQLAFTRSPWCALRFQLHYLWLRAHPAGGV